jgi:phosphatidylinositol phospholipase C delta
LTDHVPFRKVCEAIASAMDDEIAAAQTGPKPAPIFISLENHCTPPAQLRLASIMQEVFGEKLVTEQLHPDGTDATLDELSGRILVMVEYYGLDEKDVPEDPHDSSEEEDTKEHRKKKAANKPSKIVPELSALGVYAQSMKPGNDDWLKGDLSEPAHHLVNVEERAVQALLEANQGDNVAKHNSKHFMRIYPKGTRIGEFVAEVPGGLCSRSTDSMPAATRKALKI